MPYLTHDPSQKFTAQWVAQVRYHLGSPLIDPGGGSNMPHFTSVRSPRLKAALHQKGSLELFIYEKPVNRA